MRVNSKFDQHRLDCLIKPLGNFKFMTSASIVFLTSGILLSVLFNDWHWFSLFGSLGTILGILLTMSPVFSKGVYLSQASSGVMGGLDNEGNPRATTKKDRNIGDSVLIGITLTVVGTLISAFGDLIT